MSTPLILVALALTVLSVLSGGTFFVFLRKSPSGVVGKPALAAGATCIALAWLGFLAINAGV